MSRKKNNRRRKRSPVRLQSSPVNNPVEVELLRQWESRMPQWLQDAEAVFDSGDKGRALELLTESRIDKAIENLSHPERVFVLYGIARVLKKFEQKQLLPFV